MRSTRQFLDHPYQASKKSNCERVKAVDALREKAHLPALLIPEEYLDHLFHTVMHTPLDFSIGEEPIIVDISTVKHFRSSDKGHPMSRQPLKPLIINDGVRTEPYKQDENLANRIHTYITIEELKLHAAACEEMRQTALLQALNGKSDSEAEQILALQASANTADVIQVNGIPADSIPKKFFGCEPHSAAMTLPVIIDGKYHIDFFELIKTLPDNHTLTAEEQVKREEHSRQYKAERVKSFINARDQQIASLKEQNNCDTEYLERAINSITTMTERQVQGLLNMKTDDLFPAEAEEYINPYTGLPIQSITIDYALLAEIDCFLDTFERQLEIVEKKAAQNDKDLKKYHSNLVNGKAYSQLLSDEEYPVEKIPESLTLGHIPGANHLEIMTHPVLLDGVYLIDLHRLQEFWKPVSGLFFGRPGCRGINPFTKQPIKTIVYDSQLKEDTDRFILNRETFKKLTTADQAQRANYLRGSQFRTHNTGNSVRRHGFVSIISMATAPESLDDTAAAKNVYGKN